MKKVLYLLTVLFISGSLLGQNISMKYTSKPTDFALIKKRKLAIQKLDVEKTATDHIFKWNNGDAGWLPRYKDFVTKYNDNMKLAFETYWKLSTEVEFKTKKEIEELFKKKDKTYIIVTVGEVNEHDNDLLTLDLASCQYIQLNRAEKGATDNLFRSPIPYSANRKLSSVTFYDCAFAVRLAIAQIEEILEKKSEVSYIDIAEDQVSKNCKFMIRDRKLMVDKDLIDSKLEKKTIKNFYKRKTGFDFTDFTMIDEAVKTNKTESAYVVSIPVSFFKSGGIGAQTTLTLQRFIVDAATGKIMEMHKSKPKPGVDLSPLQERDFELFNKDCDGDAGKDDSEENKSDKNKKGKKSDDEEDGE